jgi:uncharacterized protein (DUF488 family)
MKKKIKRLYTIGHSTHSLQEFIEILNAQGIKHVVDIRSISKSRTVPWFNMETLPISLKPYKIKYTHLARLGGLRRTSKDSCNMAWRNASFRGYADYMQTKDFFQGLKELNEIISQGEPVTIMCAEVLPWRCHRSLIADAELARHYKVFDIMSKEKVKPHKLTSFAKINRSKRPMQILYPLEIDKS